MGDEPLSRKARDRRPQSRSPQYERPNDEGYEETPQSMILWLQQVAGNQLTNDLMAGGVRQVPENIQSSSHDQFGVGLETVRIHTDEEAERRTTAAGASAMTEGTDIYFAPGVYHPDTEEGRFALRHELAHVVQQTENKAEPMLSAKAAEVAADEAATSATGSRVAGQVAPGTAQLLPEDEERRRTVSVSGKSIRSHKPAQPQVERITRHKPAAASQRSASPSEADPHGGPASSAQATSSEPVSEVAGGLSRSRPSTFETEEIHESIAADTSIEPSAEAQSLVREKQLSSSSSPGGKSQPVQLEAGTFTHKHAEALRHALPPPDIPPRFAADVEAGNIIPLAELPSGLRAEEPIGTLFRADRVTVVDAENGIIYEIKPDNLTSIRNGQNQVLRSVELANQSALEGRRDWRGIVVVYNRDAARKLIAPPARVRPTPVRGPTSGRGAAPKKSVAPSTREVATQEVSESGRTGTPSEPSSSETGHYDVRPPVESQPEQPVRLARGTPAETPKQATGEPKPSILIDPEPLPGLGGGPAPSRRAAAAGAAAEAGTVVLPVLIDALSRYGANLAAERELAAQADQIAAARTTTTGVVVVVNFRHTLQGDPTAGISTTEFVSLYPVAGFPDLSSGIEALKEQPSMSQDVQFSFIDTAYLWVPPLPATPPATVPVAPLR